MVLSRDSERKAGRWEPSAAWLWLNAHRDELDVYAGRWVTIGPEGIVGAGTADEAMAQAEAKKVTRPLLVLARDSKARKQWRV